MATNRLRTFGLGAWIATLLVPFHVYAWQTNPPRFSAEVIAVDAQGDVIAAGNGDFRASRDGPWDVMIVAKFSGDAGKELWRAMGDEEGTAHTVATDAQGDVYVAGTTGDLSKRFTVAKLSGADGTRMWRAELTGTLPGSYHGNIAYAVVVDGAGDLIAAGSLSNEDTGGDFAVVKLRGATGEELWRRSFSGSEGRYSNDHALSVGLDRNGDVFAGGYVHNSGQWMDFVVAKLSGSTGAELWRYELNGEADDFDRALTLAIDNDGDAVVGGYLSRAADSGVDFAVIKLSGADGIERWRHVVDGAMSETDLPGWVLDGAHSVVVDAAGDVFAGGTLYELDGFSEFTVMKLASSNGSELWRQTLDGTGDDSDSQNVLFIPADAAKALAVDSNGDVIATGQLFQGGSRADFATVRFSGTDGTVLWQTLIDGTQVLQRDRWQQFVSFDVDWGSRVAIHPSGDVIALASLSQICSSLAGVVRLSGLDGTGAGGTDDCLVTGKKLTIRDHADDPARRRMGLTASERGRVLAGTVGSQSDPTIHGATLKIYDPATQQLAEIDLPAGNWTARRGGEKGYLYRDTAMADGPCVHVSIGPPTRLRMRCGGEQFGFTLGEPIREELVITLETGIDATRYCMVFGGTIVSDAPAVGGQKGLFKAIKAPAPSLCPSVP
jgi:hypothetical protein